MQNKYKNKSKESKVRKINLKFVFIFGLILFLVSLVLYYFLYPKYLEYKSKDLNYYYNYISNLEKTDENFSINKKNLQEFLNCKSDYTCIKNFYEKLTIREGLQNSFSFLKYINKNYPEYLDMCHQSTHGIGYGQLKINNGDVQKSFADPYKQNYFNDLINCGAGYFHGIIEEKSKNLKTKDEIINSFRNICGNKQIIAGRTQSCLHGLGHAAFLQIDKELSEKIKDSLYVCDSISVGEINSYSCYTGVFMQAQFDLPPKELLEKVIDKKEYKYNFKFCNNLNENYKYACIMEISPSINSFLSKDQSITGNINYFDLIKECQNIVGDLGKIACIKKISEDAVLDGKVTNIKKLCQENTKTRAGRIFCTGVFAGRVAKEIDISFKDMISQNAIKDICNTLENKEEGGKCLQIVLKNFNSLYFVDKIDLGI